jgi:hypothetical protein
MKLDALKQVQALYDAAGLGPLNFKFRSPYNWHLLKSRSTSLGDNKNQPQTKKKADEPTPTA